MDTTLNNVYLYNGMTRLTDAATVSNGVVTFNSPNGLFTVNGSMTVSVRADIASGQGSQTIGMTLASYTVAGATAPNMVSIPGNIQIIAQNSNAAMVQLGTNTYANLTQSINAGQMNYVVWSDPITVSTRTVNLQSLTLKYIGSAPANAFANMSLYIDGNKVGNTSSIDNNNNVSFDLSASPLALTTGSHTVELHADIVGGSYRNAQFSLQDEADLMAADSQLGVFVAPYTTYANNTYTFTQNTGAVINIAAGSVSVTIDPNFTPTQVTAGATNVAIAQYKMTSYGEDVKVTSLNVEPLFNGGVASMNNVSLFWNGGQIGSTINDASSSALTFQLGSSLVIPAGQTGILMVKADTIRNDTNAPLANGIGLTVALSGNTSNAQGQTSLNPTTVPSSAVTSNPLTVTTTGVAVAANSNYTNQTIAPNTTHVMLGSFVIQAGSAEGLRVNNLQVSLNGTQISSASPLASGIQNLTISAPGVESSRFLRLLTCRR